MRCLRRKRQLGTFSSFLNYLCQLMVQCIHHRHFWTSKEIHWTIPTLKSAFLFSIDAAVLILASQVTYIPLFFLTWSRNIPIARDRAWDQTVPVAYRGKGPDFGTHVEGWQNPPSMSLDSKLDHWQFVNKRFSLFVLKRGMFFDRERLCDWQY